MLYTPKRELERGALTLSLVPFAPVRLAEIPAFGRWPEMTCFTLPSGGSDAIAAGEGPLSCIRSSYKTPIRIALSGPEGPTLPEGE